jgi:hypothetical protein
MITNAREAMDFVRKHGIVTMTRSATRPSFVEAVAGEPVRGSWWGHPKGALIYRLADTVTGSGDVFTLKFVDGKVTFLHRDLWPALARVVTDPEWRRPRVEALPPKARTLFDEIEKRGSRRLDPKRKAEGSQLEKSLLVHGGSVHTESGAHATVLTAWRKVFDRKTAADSRDLAITDAMKLLGLRTSVP